MNIYTKGKALAAAAVFALATAAPAMADHDTVGADLSADGTTITLTCDTFGALEYTLRNHVSFGNDGKPPYQDEDPVMGKDREGLERKLTEAHRKDLHEDPPKPCDAAQKLDDFSSKVTQLRDGNTADKIKISDDTKGSSIQCLIDGSAALAKSLIPAAGCDSSGGKPGGGKGPKNK